MKGLIVGALALLIAGGTTYTVVSMNNETKSGNEGDTPVTEQVNTEEVIQAPTERTIDIPETNFPWEVINREKQREAMNSGGQVYLFDDGAEIESRVVNVKNTPKTSEFSKEGVENLTIEKVANGWAQNIHLYVEDVKEFYPDKEEYFNKMIEVADDLEAQDFDAVDAKIEEAKQLRLQ